MFNVTTNKFQIVVEVRDHGTGSRGEVKLTWDALAPKFSLTPMRPYFSREISDLFFIIDSEGVQEGNITVKYECISQQPPEGEIAIETFGKVNEIVHVDLPKQWRTLCNVIKVTGKRKLKTGFSRGQTVLLPNMHGTALASNFISIDDPKIEYRTGEILSVTLKTSDAKILNYMVICDSHKLIQVETTRDDRKLKMGIVESMKGTCVLYVYTSLPNITTDMYLFRVVDQCDGSMTVSRVINGDKYEMNGSNENISPGEELEIQLVGDRNGFAVYRAIDDRMNQLALKNDILKLRLWDFSVFSSQSASTFQARIANLMDLNQVQEVLSRECTKAGRRLHPRCPTISYSSSVLSNVCLKYLQTGCHQQPPANSTTLAQSKDKREHMFERISMKNDGRAHVKTISPDNIGEWALSSAFWSPGRTSMCPLNNFNLQSKKNVFMEVDLPKDVYVNETVSVKVTVSGINIQRLSKYSICIAKMPRKVCADEGSNGNKGRPAYTNIALSKNSSVQSKTFSMRFLVTGITNVTFYLREEASYPGKHHCDVGKILDIVKIHLKIAKRADTVEYYKKVLLNAGKPVVKVQMNDDVQQESENVAIEVLENRPGEDPTSVVTTVVANILDTETVYSFAIYISKFLPTKTYFEDSQSRIKRGIFDSGNSFLSDVIKQLSVELYRFKTIAQKKDTELYTLEWAQKRISNLISDMLRFSDCTSSAEPCGYAEYGAPRSPAERSLFLTSIATSLLCEASVDEQLIAGPLQTIIADIPKFREEAFNIDLNDIFDIESSYDKKFLLASLMFQVSRDCGSYREKITQVKYDAFGQLHKSYYLFDEGAIVDDRAVAAIAFMATNVTQELMRIKMLERINGDLEPYWSAGVLSIAEEEKKSTFQVLGSRRSKSGDIMVNSLGLLAFVTAGAEGSKIEWDPLADWLFKQQNEDGTFESPIDTYFASRALYEYKTRKVDVANNGQLQVRVECTGCPLRTINVTEDSVEIHVPTHVRSVSLTTSGIGKAKAGIRIVATRRQRQRRGLTHDDYYPVRIDCDQQHIQRTTIQQTVCLTVLSPVIRTLEITHGLYTSYTTSTQLLSMLPNSSSVSIINPAKSSYAMHFILINIPHKKPICYQLGITEPPYRHEPTYLAPVAIQARHPVSDIVGMLLIAHPDVLPRPRSRRSHRLRHGVSKARSIRSIIDQSSVDLVCFSGGQCSCAETTCGVQCRKCGFDTEENLREKLAFKNNFGVGVRVRNTEKSLIENIMYTVYHTDVLDMAGGAASYLTETLAIYLRDCNPFCVPPNGEVKRGEKYLIIGHIDGLTLDSNGTQNYVLRDTDRFEEATTDCKHLNTAITLRDRR
ncbi:unnamed protein product [Caenorhabditis auriculariae]|uniref:Alpha-2-macroglobulin domain-containing protein n=1 Tax=Caenorhabditis auriculariae TaxID=2777116 RepID=A0A8S1GQV9_9PELO|nr:unnamed protein product [Caenorhabditis auriculariae]